MKQTLSQRRSLIQEIATSGVRMTDQRKTLIQTIQEADRHLDAAALLGLARRRDPRIDRATVYRTLNLLKKLRLVDELDLMHLNGEKHFYEARPTRDHVHLTCTECGKIEELLLPAYDRLKRRIALESGFEIRVIRLEVGGLCSSCRADREKKSQRWMLSNAAKRSRLRIRNRFQSRDRQGAADNFAKSMISRDRSLRSNVHE